MDSVVKVLILHTNESHEPLGRIRGMPMMDRGNRHGFISSHLSVVTLVAEFLYGFHPGLHGQLISGTYPRSFHTTMKKFENAHFFYERSKVAQNSFHYNHSLYIT